MINTFLNLKFGFVKAFGMLKKTAVLESQIAEIDADYERFLGIRENQYQRFEELDAFLTGMKERGEDLFQTDEYKEYDELSKSDDIKFYLEFAAQKQPVDTTLDQVVLAENFEAGLDEAVWNKEQKAKIKDKEYNYSFDEQADIKTPENVNVEDGKLQIVTRNEEISGKVWNERFGFLQKTREYSSGFVNTKDKLKFAYGTLKIKLKANTASGLINSINLRSVDNKDYINVCNITKGKFSCGTYHNQDHVYRRHISRLSLNSSAEDYIYEVEWAADKLTWKVNNQVVRVQKNDIPSKQMFLEISSKVPKNADVQDLSQNLEVDWIFIKSPQQ